MSFTQLCVVLVTVPLTVVSQQVLDPCGDWKAKGRRCGYGEECRLVQEFCFRQRCPPRPRCVPKRLPISSCRHGDPVLDINYRPLSCYPGRECPYHTTCNTEVLDTQTTCCWTPRGPSPLGPSPPGPSPPGPSPPGPSPPMINPCAATLCVVGQTCEVQLPTNCFFGPCRPIGVCVDNSPVSRPCALKFCGQGYRCEERAAPCPPPGPCPLTGVCVKSSAVNTGKAGQCPSIVTGVCDINCEMDSDCDGPMKCCKHKCGALCVAPRGTVTQPGPVLCSSMLCGPGYLCEDHPTTCLPPGPCPLQGVCVKDSAVTAGKPGQCPANVTPICDVNCESDLDCEGPMKCCTHKCGAQCVASLNTTAPITSDYPCFKVDCSFGTECRLREVNCVRSTCPPVVDCVPTKPKAVEQRCPVGDPILDINGKELFCGRGPRRRVCPDSTYCNVHPTDRYAVCCYRENQGNLGNQQNQGNQSNQGISRPPIRPVDPIPPTCAQKICARGEVCRLQTIFCIRAPCPPPIPQCRRIAKPGSCPRETPTDLRRCRSRCSIDADCSGSQKCCGRCRQCRDPATLTPSEKPGNCPVSPPAVIGICIARCSTDSQCPGIQKCCGSCPRECKEPGPQVLPFPTSCDQKACARDEVCRLEQLFVCVTRPCNGQIAVCRKRTKQGTCPRETAGVLGPCFSRCSIDGDCRGNEKCCGQCNRQCRDPATLTPTDKPGNCPVPKPGVVGICLARCSSDSECPGNQKCCGNCPRECTSPDLPVDPSPASCKQQTCARDEVCRLETIICKKAPCPSPRAVCRPINKPGTCPRETPGELGRCFSRCLIDGDCPGNEKCCGQCNRQCTAQTGKPGKCPASQSGLVGLVQRCQRPCAGDRSCPGIQKCCLINGCGQVCREPLATFADTDPCRTKKCFGNQVCRLQRVQCVKAPCKVITTCANKTTADTLRQCRSGYPVIDTNQSVITCNTASDCPGRTVCPPTGVCCWD